MSSSPATATGPNRRALKSALAEVSLRDEHRLRRRLDRARDAKALGAVAQDIDKARTRLANRAASVPKISYPETLPVSARRDDIAAAIAANQVVIVAGETGSGKTTQIPKICLELGRGIRGAIGHTQPRRLAAALSPSGSRKSSAPNWAMSSATRCASPIRRRSARWSS
jgi:ATP-dependent helicase HrpA